MAADKYTTIYCKLTKEEYDEIWKLITDIGDFNNRGYDKRAFEILKVGVRRVFS